MISIKGIDEAGSILYEGSSNIKIESEKVVSVTIVLTPTSKGLGAVYIFVKWKTQNFDWSDFPGNPIVDKTESSYDPYGVAHQFVIKDDNTYKMWYSGIGSGGKTHVFLMTSNDGLSWVAHSQYPVMYSGDQGTWDEGRISAGPVIKENGVYKMYYAGWDHSGGHWGIGLAESGDGINWVRRAQPVVFHDEGWATQMYPSSIVTVNDLYYLYYSGKNSGSSFQVGLAVSSDGVIFEDQGQEPLMINTEPWEGVGVMYPSVIIENNQFKMVYSTSDSYPTQLGMAKSNDGINWEKDLENPFFTIDDVSGNWNRIAYPNMIKTDKEYRIYYTAIYSDVDRDICVARRFF